MQQNSSVLVLDIETNSLNVEEADTKIFIAVSYPSKEKYFLTYKD